MIGAVINGRYQIVSELGSGGYGQVYKVQDLKYKTQKAIKLSKSHQSLLSEYKILRDLQGEGIPKVFKYGEYNFCSFFIMQLLGNNLYTLLRSNQIGSDSILNILFQCLQRIEYIHNKSYIHRDIKPHQFVTGNNNQIYLLDFGISTKYTIDKCHITSQSSCRFVGSCHFASMNAHIGLRLTRRDDLESFVYSAIFLITKTLPWIENSAINEFNKWNLVFRCKREMLQSAPKNYPEEILEMLRYATSLKFEETPDYQYLKELIKKMGKNIGPCEIQTKARLTQHKRHSLREKTRIHNKRPSVKILKTKSKTVLQNQIPIPNLLSHSNISTNHNTSLEETEKGSLPELSLNLRNLLHKSSKTRKTFK